MSQGGLLEPLLFLFDVTDATTKSLVIFTFGIVGWENPVVITISAEVLDVIPVKTTLGNIIFGLLFRKNILAFVLTV